MALENLIDLQKDSPEIRKTFLTMTKDPSERVRLKAIEGICYYPTPEATETLLEVLKRDTSSEIRRLCANILSQEATLSIQETFMELFESESSEDVKITIVRALGKRQSVESEKILIDILTAMESEPQPTMPALMWVTIKSLASIAITERSLQCLKLLQGKCKNEIIESSIDYALRKINKRLEEFKRFQQLSNQLNFYASDTSSDIFEEESPILMPSS